MMSIKNPTSCGGLPADNSCVRTSGGSSISSPPTPGCQRLVLKHTPDVLPPIPGMSEINSWTPATSAAEPVIPDIGYGTRNAPKIEILEIGWRR
jgi:hypothetical protein